MKQLGKTLAQFLVVMAVSGLIISQVAVASYLEVPKEAYEIYSSSGIPAPDVAANQGQETVVKFIIEGVLPYVKVLAGVVGLVFITLMGYTLVTSSGNDEEISRARRGIVYCIIAFIIISMSQDIAKIFDMRKDTLLGSPQSILQRVHLFDSQVEIFVTFVKYILGAYATLMIVRSGIGLVTSGGDDEEVGKNRRSIMYSLGGLGLLYVGDIFINKVFYRINKSVYSGITGVHPQADAKEGVEQIVGITNLVVSFVGPIAVLMLLAGAVMYATAGGEDDRVERAKRIIIASLVGIVIIYGAFALVSTILAGRLEDLNAVAQ
jgi:cytochrome bd-type quinol oxidase subunit 2